MIQENVSTSIWCNQTMYANNHQSFLKIMSCNTCAFWGRNKAGNMANIQHTNVCKTNDENKEKTNLQVQNRHITCITKLDR